MLDKLMFGLLTYLLSYLSKIAGEVTFIHAICLLTGHEAWHQSAIYFEYRLHQVQM